MESRQERGYEAYDVREIVGVRSRSPVRGDPRFSSEIAVPTTTNASGNTATVSRENSYCGGPAATDEEWAAPPPAQRTNAP